MSFFQRRSALRPVSLSAPQAVWASDGLSSGLATCAAVGAALVLAVGSASGLSTTTANGVSTAASIGSSTGTSTATAVGASVASGLGASSGTCTATAVGKSNAAAIGSSSGTCTATAVGRSTAAAVGSSSGTCTATSVGIGVAASTGSSTGVSGQLALPYRRLAQSYGAVAFYPFSDPKSGARFPLLDFIGSNHGTTPADNVGVTPLQPGPLANGELAARLDRSANTYYVVPDAAVLHFTTVFSADIWFKFRTGDDDGSNNCYFSFDNGNGCYVESVGGGSFFLYGALIDGSFTSLFVGPITPPTADVWHQLVAVYDGSNLNLYLDKVLIGQTPATGTLNLGINGLTYGSNGGVDLLKGDLAQAALYNSALTPAQITALYDAASSTRHSASSAASVGSAAGTSTTSGVGSSTAQNQGVGSATGASTVAAVGRSTATAVGSTSGTVSATAVGLAVINGIGFSNGISTSSAIGNPIGRGDGVSSGFSAATATAMSFASSVGFAVGTSTVKAETLKNPGVIDIVGEYKTTLDVLGRYSPSIDILGELE